MYWYNATPKDNETLSSVPANGIYQFEQRVKGIDPKQSLPDIRSNAYQVGEPVWVEPLDCLQILQRTGYWGNQSSDSAGQWNPTM